MQITPATLPLLKLLRAGGLNRAVRGWDRILRNLFPLRDQADTLIETVYRGRPYAASPRHYVDWQVLTTGAYEHDDLVVLETLIRCMKDPVVLDIGTNVGHHAFFFATLGADVHAFEPNPALWSIVEAKAAAAQLGNIRLHKCGLADRDDVLTFHVPDGTNSGTGQFVDGTLVVDAAVQTLPVRNGDAFLAAQQISKIDLIKIDVQGFEPQVLIGLKTTIAASRPVISVEIGAENRGAIPTLEDLTSLLPGHYTFARIAFRHVGPLLFRKTTGLSPSDFASFEGNLLCVPEEHASWLAMTA